jgi:hypothetical protein
MGDSSSKLSLRTDSTEGFSTTTWVVMVRSYLQIRNEALLCALSIRVLPDKNPNQEEFTTNQSCFHHFYYNDVIYDQ